MWVKVEQVCANKLYRKILLGNCAIRIRIFIIAMLEFLTSCVTSISTFDYLVGVTSNDENYLPISTLLH